MKIHEPFQQAPKAKYLYNVLQTGILKKEGDDDLSTDVIQKKGDIKRIKTYISGLDQTMEGGIPENHIVLICGSSGTMKSSICFNLVYNEALAGKVGLYFSLEQGYSSLLNHLINMGYDFSKVEIIVVGSNIEDIKKKLKTLKDSGKGGVIISDLGDLRKEIKDSKMGASGDWWVFIRNVLSSIKKEIDFKILVLDSLDALYVLSNFEEARNKLFYLFEYLRDLNVTSFLISEMPLDGHRYGRFEVEDYLADGIIMLRLVERYRKVTREISVVKMRTTNCNIDVFTLVYDGRIFKAEYGGKPPLI
ncbi:MAG: ATPase domain-containing protein [Candidatus Woesearchaeota archaeon]